MKSKIEQKMKYQYILYSVEEGVATITLNTPEKFNVLGIGEGSNRDEIISAVNAADTDDYVGAILINAKGKAFCAGGDLSGVSPTETLFDEFNFIRGIGSFYENLKAIRKPIICVVQGLCLGAGLGFVAQSDFILAADDARFGLIEGRIGHPGATELVPIIGATWAKFMMLTGELIDAEHARQIGLVLTVEAKDKLLSRGIDLARRIARLPKESVALNKACIDRMADAMGDDAGRIVGRSYDTLTKAMAKSAKAPDGQLFETVFREQGTAGLKMSRDAQFTGSWLKPKAKN